MFNKKALRTSESYGHLSLNPQSEKSNKTSSSRSPMRSSTTSLAETLHKILQVNRSKRKLDISMPSPLSGHNMDKSPRGKDYKLSPKSDCSVVQDTLRALKQKSIDCKCSKPKHEYSRLSYLCLEPLCHKSRLGCANCFIQEHESHRKTKVEDFLRGFTHGYLDYLERFDQFLKGISSKKQKEMETLELQLQHLKESFNLYIDKLSKQLKRDLNQQLNSSVHQYHGLMQRSIECINLLNELQNPSNSLLTFENRVQSLVLMDYQHINNGLIDAIQRLKLDDGCSDIYKDRFTTINNTLSQLFFAGPSTNRQSQSLSSMRSRNELLVKCPLSHKNFLNVGLSKTTLVARTAGLQPTDYVNSLTYFHCCCKKYCCTNCHDRNEGHQSEESMPSDRVCLKCDIMYEVPFGSNTPINCKNCMK